MASVFTICPATGRMIETGIDTDTISLALSRAFVSRAFCPHCNAEHEWSKDTVWLENHDGKLVRL